MQQNWDGCLMVGCWVLCTRKFKAHLLWFKYHGTLFFFFFGKSYPLPPMMMEVEDGVKPPKKTRVLNGSWIYHFLWVREEKFWRFRMEHVHEKPLKTNEYEKSPESWCLGSMIHWMKVCSSPKSQGSTMAPGRRLPWTWGEEPLCQLAQWG